MSESGSFVDEAYKLFENAYAFFNERLFSNTLPPCIITFQRQARLMGYVAFKRWVNIEGKTIDELAINPAYFANYSITTILQTLCHEMVHIWQEYHGKPSRPGYHNSEWAEKMKQIGLMPSSTGKPGGSAVGNTMSDYVIEGGKFEKACAELLSSGFRLRWYDTIQMPPPADRPQKKQESNVVALTRANVPRTENANSATDMDDIYSNFPLNLQDIAEQIEQQQTEEQNRLLRPKVSTTNTKNRSNRHKYFCPQCFMQVWGKPNLNVTCGDCNINLLEET
ncbi:MAG: SprT-like domain-containing protein [Cellvibrionaceae bacterium]